MSELHTVDESCRISYRTGMIIGFFLGTLAGLTVMFIAVMIIADKVLR